MARKIIKTKTYTIKCIHYDDGTTAIYRTNKGFSVIEMIALAELVKANNINIILGQTKEITEADMHIKSTDSPAMRPDNF